MTKKKAKDIYEISFVKRAESNNFSDFNNHHSKLQKISRKDILSKNNSMINNL
jgi:hypothetical protein